MGSLFTDAFTGTTGDDLDVYNSTNWQSNAQNDIDTNAAAADANIGNYGFSAVNGITFADDQYSEATVLGLHGSRGIGVACRIDSDTFHDDGYLFECRTGATQLASMVTGTTSQLSSASTIATNDVIRIEAEGTTITAYINGSTTNAPAATTNSDHSGGVGGLCAYGRQNSAQVDDLDTGDIDAGGDPTGYMTTNTGYWGT